MIEIITKLAQLAGKYPDFRFMQMVENILEHKHECHYYMSDSDFMAKLKTFEKRVDKDNPVKSIPKQNPLYPNWIDPAKFFTQGGYHKEKQVFERIVSDKAFEEKPASD